jgi:hypothetical protein
MEEALKQHPRDLCTKRGEPILRRESSVRYNLVLGKQSEKLYEGVKALIVENLQKMVKDKLIPRSQLASGAT